MPAPTDPPAVKTSSRPTSSPSPSSPSTPARPVDRLIIPPAAEALPPTWREAFVIDYGAAPELLGTSPGGDAGSLDIGPEYGAPGPDGTWWFLDGAKRRVAHYDRGGRFLGAASIPRRLLVAGQYFQWQLPHVLADGTLVAVRQTGDGSALLRVRDGAVDEVAIDDPFVATYDDGTALFGFVGQSLARVEVATGVSTEATELPTPAGSPFTIRIDAAKALLTVDPPGGGGGLVRLPLRTTNGAKARVGIQVRAGAGDTLHLFLVGTGEDDESVQLVGYASVGPAGEVSEVERLPDPFSEADPGSPAHLVLAPGSSTPMLVYVLEDGVHVYERVG